MQQALRKERGEFCVEEAAINGREMQLSEEEAAERDRRFREASKDGGKNPDKFVDKLSVLLPVAVFYTQP